MITLFSKLTGFALNVATIAALSAADAGHLEDGAIGWTGDVRDQWVLAKNALAGTAADGINVVAATGAGASAFWFRQIISDPYWAYQITWYVDPVAGLDTNTGATNVTALKTVGEVSRRMQYGKNGSTYVINILGDVPVTDAFTPTVKPFGANSATTTVLTSGITFQFVGQRTTVRSGTFAAGTQQTDPTRAAATAQAEAVDAGVATWAADVGSLIVNQDGKTAWVLSAKGGGTTARVTDWLTSAFAWTTTPAVGNTYSVVSLTRWRAPIAMTFIQGAQTLTASLVFDNLHFDNLQLSRLWGGVAPLWFTRTCKFSNEQASLAGAATNTLNFPVQATGPYTRFIISGGTIQNYGTGIAAVTSSDHRGASVFNAGTGAIKCRFFNGYGTWFLQGLCLQAGWIQFGTSSGEQAVNGTVLGSLSSNGGWIGVYNDFDLPGGSGIGAALQIGKSNGINVVNSVYGVQDTNTAIIGLLVRDAGVATVLSTIFEQGSGSETTTTCWNLQASGGAQQISINSLTQTMPNINTSAGAVLPAVQNCQTFNQYRTTFARNMQDWANGAGVKKYS